MITGLEINSLSEKKIEMYELTKNVIVLFNNSELKNKFRKEFLKINYDDTETELDLDNDIVYSTVSDDSKVDEQDHKAEIKEIVTYLPTSMYMVDNEQKFILTTEAPFVLQCNNPYDLWFCDTNGDNEVQLWSFVDFKGYKETWSEGVEKVYREFASGRFGCYEGYGR